MDSQEFRALPVVVSAPAEIDATNAAELRAALLSAASKGPTVVVDMSQTVFCDSAGVSALVQARHRAEASGGEVWLVITNASVLRIVALTGVDQLLLVFASLPDALAARPAPSPPAEALGSR
jgi:anti-sigma B factor antagonist